MKKREKKRKKGNLPEDTFLQKEVKDTGKITGNGTIVYSFHLPKKSSEETEFLLQKVKAAFLSFLEKESRKKREKVYLGTLSYRWEEGRLILLSSYSPFEEKDEKAVATIFYSEKGKIRKITK